MSAAPLTALPGVRMPSDHWSHATVHSFRRSDGSHTVETWCGLTADLEAGAAQTTDLITCQQCGQASWEALR